MKKSISLFLLVLISIVFYSCGGNRILVEESIEELQTAVKNDPNNEVSYYNLGIGYISQEQYPEAIAALKDALKINEHFSQAYFALYCSEMANDKNLRKEMYEDEPSEEYKEKIDTVNQYLEMALTTYPFFEWKLAFLLLPPKEYSFNTYTQMLLDKYYSLFYDGYEKFIKGEYPEAIEKYNTSLKQIPSFNSAKYFRGMSYALNNNFKEAIADFQSIADSTESMNKKKILPIYINTAEMHFLIGCAQSKLSNYPEAEAAFQNALTEDYSYYMAHYYLADIYNKQGRFNDALGELDAALLVAPNDAIMHYNKAVFLFQMKKYADALDEYENTVKINPKLYKAQYNAAIIYEAMKNNAKALEYYQGFLDNAPLREEALIAKAKEKINLLKNN